MKYYHAYMERQKISQERHARLLELGRKEAPERAARPVRRWQRVAALAACCALALGLGVWKLALDQGGPHSTGDASGPGGSQQSIQSNSADSGKLMFSMLPSIDYPELDGTQELVAADIALPDGSFERELTQADIQTIFWGPEGKHAAGHSKTEQGDLPQVLFWEDYDLHGRVIYDGEGKLFWLLLFGEHPDGPSFELEMALDRLPPTCLAEPEQESSEVFGVQVTGWSRAYDRNGDGVTDYICGSEFMAGDVGVRFENTGSPFRSEYGGADNPEMGGAQTLNALFVRRALAEDGGLYLEHLRWAEDIPEWREETFDTLAQARQEAAFAPYLPTQNLAGYGEFYGHLSYQAGGYDTLWVRWSRGYDDVEIEVRRPEGEVWWGETVDVSEPASYDTRLYTVPWYDSVPEEYRDSFYKPAFRAQDMSLEVVKARGTEKDTGGMSYCFYVLHEDGTLVGYNCDGLTAEQVWTLMEETLKKS